MKIYIPSMGRAHLIKEGTIKVWPEDLKVSFVVPEDEAAVYVDSLEKIPFAEVLGTDAVGIAETRYKIGCHAKECGAEKFLMLDDDLRFSHRVDPDSTKLTLSEPAQVRGALITVSVYLDDNAAAGISARQGNNHCKGEASSNTRLIRALGFRTDPFLQCEHGRVDVMEDFDVLLQLLRMGHSNKVSFRYAQDQKGTQTEGGCSSYRSQAVHTASAQKLAELHKGFVRLTLKQNKTGGEFGTRTEVVISWKKAYNENS